MKLKTYAILMTAIAVMASGYGIYSHVRYSQLAKSEENGRALNRPVDKKTLQKEIEKGVRDVDSAPYVEWDEKPFQDKKNDKDIKPKVEFADKGHYLPPVGNKSLVVDSVNVTNIEVSVASLVPANIVQLLARDESQYNRGSVDMDRTPSFELAAKAVDFKVPTHFKKNEKKSILVPLSERNLMTSNGVYVVAIVNGDKPVEEGWYANDYNPRQVKVVCVSDIGLSVRKDENRVYVWATSLTNGKPLQNASVEVYSAANQLMGKGVTGDDGLVKLTMPIDTKDPLAEGPYPFAAVVRSADGKDISFIVMSDKTELERLPVTASYLDENTGLVKGFAWTDRGIYRHGEKIMFRAILRDYREKAPKPFPIEVSLVSPEGKTVRKQTCMTTADGLVETDEFAVDDFQPSGTWSIEAIMPGKDKFKYAVVTAKVKIEEFAPPQVRVSMKGFCDHKLPDLCFTIAGEHLYGGPAVGLRAEGAIVFEDAPFEPKEWKGYRFGDDDAGLKPSYRKLKSSVLDANGECTFSAPMFEDKGQPKAAVRVIAQGTVIEDGGRAAVCRSSAVRHLYPYYIGALLPSHLKKPMSGRPTVDIACVLPTGEALATNVNLTVDLLRIDNVYNYKTDDNGWQKWTCERVRKPVVENVALEYKPGNTLQWTMPIDRDGDYVLRIYDNDSNVAFGKQFWYSSFGDEAVHAPMTDPTEVSLATDRNSYRVGEVPVLTVKSPFAGTALVTIEHNNIVHTEVLKLDAPTSAIRLPAISREWSPNVTVTVAVIKSAEVNERRQQPRAYGKMLIKVRPIENEVPVTVEVMPNILKEGGAKVDVKVTAKSSAVTAKKAIVTLVDEGINILTGEKVPNPVEELADSDGGYCGDFDIYKNILPAYTDKVILNGVKTGGGFGAEMLSRVSPVSTRRFKPLAKWTKVLDLVDGEAVASFDVGEFVGEVRVTAVAFTDSATGAGAAFAKVAPKLIMQPDAPRFVAPGDKFPVTLPLASKSDKPDDVMYEVTVSGIAAEDRKFTGVVNLAAGKKQLLTFDVVAGDRIGNGTIVYTVAGLGEHHRQTIELPVRPASGWKETAGTILLKPGESYDFSPLPGEVASTNCLRLNISVSGSPLAKLATSIDYLLTYPYGCTEQTASQMMPLIYANGILAAVETPEAKEQERERLLKVCHARLLTAVRYNAVMAWPGEDGYEATPEVSLYAIHTLLECDRNASKSDGDIKDQLLRLSYAWTKDKDLERATYGCHNIALAGKGRYIEDRMNSLFDCATNMTLLARARLARAYVMIQKREKAEKLLSLGAIAPGGVKDAAFAILALLELNANDDRIPALVEFINSQPRDAEGTWGTTELNAHALMALGAYYSHFPPTVGKADVRREGYVVKNVGDGDAFVSWHRYAIPLKADGKAVSTSFSIEKNLYDIEGKPVNLEKLACGELLVNEIVLTAKEDIAISDVVIDDPFAAALEPVRGKLKISDFDWIREDDADFLICSEKRDDRFLGFTKRFVLKKNRTLKFHYPSRVVTPGEYTMPAVTAECMYAPSLKASGAVRKIRAMKGGAEQ